MKQKITGFHQDHENHWVAELECGHGQHVRHDPPWMERPWVLTLEEREKILGQELNCVRCDEMGLLVAKKVITESRQQMISQYESGGMQGLCQEGRWELALDVLNVLDLPQLVEAALKK